MLVGDEFYVAKGKWAVPKDAWWEFDIKEAERKRKPKDDGGWGQVKGGEKPEGVRGLAKSIKLGPEEAGAPEPMPGLPPPAPPMGRGRGFTPGPPRPPPAPMEPGAGLMGQLRGRPSFSMLQPNYDMQAAYDWTPSGDVRSLFQSDFTSDDVYW